MIVVAQTPSTSKSPWTVIRLPAAIAAPIGSTTSSIALEGRRGVGLVGSEEGARLLGRPVAAADQGDRDRLAEAEVVGEARAPRRRSRARRRMRLTVPGTLSG